MKTVVKVETERLESANRHIVAIEERIQTQRHRLANFASKGDHYEHSQRLLTSLVDTLGIMKKYRQQVIYHLVEARSQPQGLQHQTLSNPDQQE